MTALAAKFEQFDGASVQAFVLLLVLTSALLPTLALTSVSLAGNLLLRYP